MGDTFVCPHCRVVIPRSNLLACGFADCETCGSWVYPLLASVPEPVYPTGWYKSSPTEYDVMSDPALGTYTVTVLRGGHLDQT